MKKKTTSPTNHLARQVLADEFLGANAELVLKIFRELNSDPSPLCRAAAQKIRRDYYAHKIAD